MAFAAVIGDSYTFNTGNGLVGADFYSHQAQKRLADVKVRNFGVSGNTSAQAVARMGCMTQFEVPVWAGVYVGANDGSNASTVAASPSPTTTVFALGAGKGGVTAAPGSWITVNGETRQVQSVSTDTVTLAVALSGAPTAGDAVTIGTQKNIEQIVSFLNASGCDQVWVGSWHYLNYSDTDTVSTPAPSLAAIRAAQAAAATAQDCPLLDFYAIMRARIVAGTDTQNYASTTVAASLGPNLFTVASASGLTVGKKVVADGLLGDIIGVAGNLITTSGLKIPPNVNSVVTTNWHIASTDPHLNPYGEWILGQAVADLVIEQGWGEAA